MSGTPIPTARRNVVWRIEQFLRVQEALEAPTLTGWQTDTVMAAITALDEERFADGESAIMKAERPDLWEPKRYEPIERLNAHQLLKRLENAQAT